MRKNVGVDGCRAGWFAVSRSGAGLEWRLFSTIEELAAAFCGAGRILIDVPIGLPWTGVPIRPCDRLARQILGRPRKSSVFPVPCREALAAGDIEGAGRINRMHMGRSVGAQTWGISCKIKEVDEFLLSLRGRPHAIREVHPEVCFWALAGRRSMSHSKTTVEGRGERLRILRRYEPDIAALVRNGLSKTLRKEVQADDILDASAAFVTAEARRGELTLLTGAPTHDQAGLPMEMLYLSI